MHLTECYENANGKLKNGAAGNSHEGQAAERHCIASPKLRTAPCSSQHFRVTLPKEEEKRALR